MENEAGFKPPNYPGPGEVVDQKGVPIYPGDLVRSKHFYYRKRRRWSYLYHVVVAETRGEGERRYPCLRLVPYWHRGTGDVPGGGDPLLVQDIANGFEIIASHAGSDAPYFLDRKRVTNPTQREENLGGHDADAGELDSRG